MWTEEPRLGPNREQASRLDAEMNAATDKLIYDIQRLKGKTMTTRCKFKLTGMTSDGWFTFKCQYDTTIPEDIAFTKYTPSGTIEVNINNPAVVAALKLGASYYVDITAAPATPTA